MTEEEMRIKILELRAENKISIEILYKKATEYFDKSFFWVKKEAIPNAKRPRKYQVFDMEETANGMRMWISYKGKCTIVSLSKFIELYQCGIFYNLSTR